MSRIDGVLLIAYGGPNAPEEIRPFLDVVLHGRPVPPERLEEVVHHYEVIGGMSPITELTKLQAHAVQQQLAARGRPIRAYVGMRNWHPFLADTVQQMSDDGVKQAAGIIMAAYRSETSWERYQSDVAQACTKVGSTAPQFTYVEPYYNSPGFIEAVAAGLDEAFDQLPVDAQCDVPLIFTAHSIPTAMADQSPYVEQLNEACRLAAERAGHAHWRLAYQSRSGNPRTPWLEPDILEVLRDLAGKGVGAAVVSPIGFLCDHVEVLYDLDIAARQLCDELGISMIRAPTAGDHPSFMAALAELVLATAGG